MCKLFSGRVLSTYQKNRQNMKIFTSDLLTKRLCKLNYLTMDKNMQMLYIMSRPEKSLHIFIDNPLTDLQI